MQQRRSRRSPGILLSGILLVVAAAWEWSANGGRISFPATVLTVIGLALIAYGIYAPGERHWERYLEAEATAAKVNADERAAPGTYSASPHQHGRGKGSQPWPAGPESRMAHLTVEHGAKEAAEAALKDPYEPDPDDRDADLSDPLRLLHHELYGV